MQNRKLQEIFVVGVLFPDKKIHGILRLQVAIRSQGWDHLGNNPDKGTKYLHMLPHGAVRQFFWTGMRSSPKLSVMLSILCCSALYITLTGGLTDNEINTLVRDWGSLLKLIQILKRGVR